MIPTGIEPQARAPRDLELGAAFATAFDRPSIPVEPPMTIDRGDDPRIELIDGLAGGIDDVGRFTGPFGLLGLRLVPSVGQVMVSMVFAADRRTGPIPRLIQVRCPETTPCSVVVDAGFLATAASPLLIRAMTLASARGIPAGGLFLIEVAAHETDNIPSWAAGRLSPGGPAGVRLISVHIEPADTDAAGTVRTPSDLVVPSAELSGGPGRRSIGLARAVDASRGQLAVLNPPLLPDGEPGTLSRVVLEARIVPPWRRSGRGARAGTSRSPGPAIGGAEDEGPIRHRIGNVGRRVAKRSINFVDGLIPVGLKRGATYVVVGAWSRIGGLSYRAASLTNGDPVQSSAVRYERGRIELRLTSPTAQPVLIDLTAMAAIPLPRAIRSLVGWAVVDTSPPWSDPDRHRTG